MGVETEDRDVEETHVAYLQRILKMEKSRWEKALKIQNTRNTRLMMVRRISDQCFFFFLKKKKCLKSQASQRYSSSLTHPKQTESSLRGHASDNSFCVHLRTGGMVVFIFKYCFYI